jgi:hypothetical protein
MQLAAVTACIFFKYLHVTEEHFAILHATQSGGMQLGAQHMPLEIYATLVIFCETGLGYSIEGQSCHKLGS